MKKAFDPREFMDHVGKRLVLAFEEADQGVTPTLVGSAKEVPAREQLERLLPGFVGVGSGVVFDSNGAVSKQQDIVLYDRHYCPVFSVNNTPEATFYPVEGVIAVGEVKSTLDSTALADAFAKIRSAKALRRVEILEEGMMPGAASVPFRDYGSRTAVQGTPDESLSQTTKWTDQPYGFVLCGKFKASATTTVASAAEHWRTNPRHESPNLIVSLADGYIQGMHADTKKFSPSVVSANSVALVSDHKEGFPILVKMLNNVAVMGRTSALNRLYAHIFPNSQVPLAAIESI